MIPNTPATTATKTAMPGQLNEAGQVIGYLASLQRRQHRFGPKCLALRRRDHDQHRPHRHRTHPQRRLQIQRCLPTERGGAGQRVLLSLQRRQHRFGPTAPGSTTARPRSTSASRAAEHTRNDGYKSAAFPTELNEAGQVRGYSDRYNGGSTDLGHSAWLYDGATTIDIGLTGQRTHPQRRLQIQRCLHN